ncbi:MAG: lysostaphin resistance A-like protein [Halanaeroarchaeum sp.]
MARFVPSVGLLLAGGGIAASLVEWTGVLSVPGVGNVPGLLAAVVATAAFEARRHDVADRRVALVAGIGSGILALSASVALLYPVTVGRDPTVGYGLPAAFALGVFGVGVAYADWLAVGRDAFLRKAGASLLALSIGVVGLVVGYLFALVGVALLPSGVPLVDRGVSTALFSVGLGVVAVGYTRYRDVGLAYFDVRWPDRREWLHVAGGVVAMYVVLLAIGSLTSALGIPSTQHSIIAAARENPALLLPFVPLSWLAIGPGEELLSRNVVQKSLYDSYSRRSAVVVGTVVFTLIHLPAYATGGPAPIFATLVRLFAISLVLGVVYERTENVVVAALVHGTYDAIQFGLAYVALTSGLF